MVKSATMNHPKLVVIVFITVFCRIVEGNLLSTGVLPKAVSSELPEVTEDILKASLISHGAVALITDGTTPYETFQSFSQKLAGKFSIGVFEVSPDIQANGNIIYNLYQMMQQLKTFSKKTNDFTIIADSESSDFLKALLEHLSGNELLTWKTKLLVFAGSKRQSFSQVEHILANSNAMIVRCMGHPSIRRCSITAYLPQSLEEIHLASWTTERKLSYHSQHALFPLKFDKFIDRGQIIITGDDYKPFVKLEYLPGTTVDGEQNFSLQGPLMEVMDSISSSMNFTFTLKRPPDGSWGYVLPNGSVTGMVGQLARKEADIFIGPLSMTLNRAQVMDFTIPVRFNSLAILARVGSTEVNSWAFVMPLSTDVWVGLGISLILVTLSAMALSQIDGDKLHNRPFTYIALLLQQGVTVPNKWWKRCILCGWAVLTTVIVLIYKGNLITPLAIRYITRNIRTLSDVLEDSSITMMWEAKTSYVLAFRTAKTGEMKEIHEAEKRGRIRFIYRHEKYPDLLENLVMRGDHVIFRGQMSLQMLLAAEFTSSGKCDYYVTSGILQPNIDVIGTQKHSPILHGLNERLQSLQESGIIHHLIVAATRNSSTCYSAPSTKIVQSSFSLKNVWGIFMILVVGDSIGLLMLSLEAIQVKISGCYSDAE